ncbi:ExeA family protein [[Enterobacter] lignolyticus]|uniref:Peptidoglycan-binding domain 1 protein n=1 Tax=Enterobacter lignolyticus (strain SCF1) TaxID=701347 RepID=E3G252_ENTLS|nr:ExeA family protein [[Enterobacter] lignolyticus]ADO49186.1 Peptidoglycan-binding domain 1 protein [[Enterobacter] lignolyticus SCF1]
MYLNHFHFDAHPFQRVTAPDGHFLVDYHRDVFALLAEKSRRAGIIALVSDDEPLLAAFSAMLARQHADSLTLGAFPHLSAEALLHKLNGGPAEGKSLLHGIDTVLQRWRKTSGKLLIINAVQQARAKCGPLLGMLLMRAEELDIPLTVMLTGTPDETRCFLREAGLPPRVHTQHQLRPLTGRECQRYWLAQLAAHGADARPFSPARIRQAYRLTRGNITAMNSIAHLALLAAWTERASQVSARHLRLAAGEVLPRPRPLKRRIAIATAAVLTCATAGWLYCATLTARLPFSLPQPARWATAAIPKAPPAVPDMGSDVISQPDAMHQLYKMWGYDASADEALCQNASRVALMCKTGSATLAALQAEGYPWVAELKTGSRMNYAVVARVGQNSLDLLLNNRTWQVTRQWYQQHATGRYTLLHRLTPEGKEAISAASGSKDIRWLDDALGQALGKPPTQSTRWTAELMQRTRDFQSKAGIGVDGIAGEETLIQLMRSVNMTPSVVIPAAETATPAKGKAA